MKGILNRGINKIELVNNIRENGEGIEINKNYINKLKKEVSYEEALMFLCISTVETYGLEKEIERLNNKIQDLQADYGNKAQVERDLLKEENKRLNNIIKEVREYIDKEHKLLNLDKSGYTYTKMGSDILEILDKGDETVSTL
ncbi:MAG: hypothetical protein VZQ62_00845 [Methanosphaera sp.]|nr:hypothetical protein [Methanosphaera sp.]